MIVPAEDFTRLAFDTVALCTMGYRVNSFYNVSALLSKSAITSSDARAGCGAALY